MAPRHTQLSSSLNLACCLLASPCLPAPELLVVQSQGPKTVNSFTGLKGLALSVCVCVSLRTATVCGRGMMTGWFSAVLAKIKRLSDKYHERLRDCSEKPF